MSALDTALLRALHVAKVHLSTSELATDLATTAPGLYERLAELRKAGFDIEEHPGLGLRLIGTPDRLIADDLRARLGPNALIRDVLVFAETDSTNNRAMQLGGHGADGGVAIFAERQTAGRGRFGRHWDSASHLGIWCSLLLRPPMPASDWSRLTTWAAVAIAAAIENSLGLRADIKWPNDIQVRGRKVAGILIETGIDRNEQPFAVLGFGVNANHETYDFPPDLAQTAGSLRQSLGEMIDRTDLAVAIFHQLNARLRALEHAFHELIAEASDRSILLGHRIQLAAGASTIEGVVEELDEVGQLVVREANGAVLRLNAGDITVLSPEN
jgi:BirA family transcriptional regulator, biotin operon repressor / biotin---[acetyl-CoA-carboxylase] ligase